MNTFKCNSSFVFRFSVLAVTVMFIFLAGAANSVADDVVRKAQQEMLIRGFNAGPVDGILGPRTKRGVYFFQEYMGLEVTGELDAATQNRLFSAEEAAPDEAVRSIHEAPQHDAQPSGSYDYSQWAPDVDASIIAEDPMRGKTAARPAKKAEPRQVAKSVVPAKVKELAPKAAPEPEVAPEPKVASAPKPEPAPQPAPAPEAAPEPKVEPAPKAVPAPAAKAALASETMASGELPSGFKITGEYEVAAVSNGGSISGAVLFAGKVPPPIMEDLSKGKNSEFCVTHPEANGNIRPRTKVAVAGDRLKNAVVLIQNIEKGKDWDERVVNFDFQTCDVFPKVSVVRKTPKGVKTGILTITNQDPEILHNPHGYSVEGANRKTLFNKPLPSKGDVADVTNDFKRFKSSKDKHFFLQCDQHNFMEADARVVWNPYYAISGADGSFKIDQIPAGKYWVTVWHPYIGEVSGEVVIESGAEKQINFELAS